MTNTSVNNLNENLLIFSDIHFTKEKRLLTRHQSKQYFNEIINEVNRRSLKPKYVIFNGDLTYSGSIEEYDLLGEYFVNPLKESLDYPTILCVPGNHDSNRVTGEIFFTQYFDSGDPSYDGKTKFLTQNTHIAHSPFENYLSFCTNHNINSSLKNKLTGVHVDYESQIVFILLNSAWFSLGKEYRKFLDKMTKNLKGTSISKQLNKILDYEKAFTQYGSQTIGYPIAEEEIPVTDLFEKFDNYAIITLVHHPPSWWDRKELIAPTNVGQNDLLLDRILNLSNMLITGHNHDPSHLGYEILRSKTGHLSLGTLYNPVGHRHFNQVNNGNNFSIINFRRNRSLTYITDQRINITLRRKSCMSLDIQFNDGIRSIFGLYSAVIPPQPVKWNHNLLRSVIDLELAKIQLTFDPESIKSIFVEDLLATDVLKENYHFFTLTGKREEDQEILNSIINVYKSNTAELSNYHNFIFILLDIHFSPNAYDSFFSNLMKKNSAVRNGAILYTQDESAPDLPSESSQRIEIFNAEGQNASVYFDALRSNFMDMFDSISKLQNNNQICLGHIFAPYWLVSAKTA